MAFLATCKIAQPIQPIWQYIFALPQYPSKSHHENSISSIFLESPQQVDMKNVAKCYKHFFGYFNVLKTHGVESSYQAWIFLFRNCTIPNHKPEMRLLFQFFLLSFQLQNHMTSRLHTHILHMYGIYSQLVFRPFTVHTKKIWENETNFHTLSESLQLLQSYGHHCLHLFQKHISRCPKTSLLFQKSSNYLYYSNPYFPRINRNIRAWR